jgi:hypothetical protein
MDIHGWLRKQLEEADPDLLRGMVSSFIEALMSAEADPPEADRLRGAERGTGQSA